MNIISYTFDPVEFQALLNDVKDQLIEKINEDYGCNISPEEYVYVLRTRGCLGGILDKLLGKLSENETHRVLLRVKGALQGHSNGE